MKVKNIKGTVVEETNKSARVRFPNGDSKWFTINNDTERQQFTLGKKLTIQRQTMPTNREELFAHIERMYPKKVEFLLVTWSEGIVKRKGKNYEKMATGAGLAVGTAVQVFGTPSGKYFFVGVPGGKQVSRHRYNKLTEIEAGFGRITELTNAKIAA